MKLLLLPYRALVPLPHVHDLLELRLRGIIVIADLVSTLRSSFFTPILDQRGFLVDRSSGNGLPSR